VLDIVSFFKRLPLSQQLALTAGTCCLLATLALVALAARSSQYTQEQLQSEYGGAVVAQLAKRLSTELASGDRLGVAGELARLVDQPSIAAARALDIEGRELAAAGERLMGGATFTSVIFIAGDAAGTAEISINTEPQDVSQFRFILALSGLAILLSMAVYAVTRAMAQRLAHNLRSMSAELAEVVGAGETSSNEIQTLRERVAALPLDLLRPRQPGTGGEDHYVETAILFIYFRSLPGYLDTIDERRLQRYVATVHRMIYGATGFYDGELEVVRQFGLAIWFNGQHKAGSAALRAASCAWLIERAAKALEGQLRLSVGLGLAVGGSELGRGDDKDIYPGLYTQSAVDELEKLARQQTGGVALSPFVVKDLDLTTRVSIEHIEGKPDQLGAPADGHRDLLERQLQILLRALIKPPADTTLE